MFDWNIQGIYYKEMLQIFYESLHVFYRLKNKHTDFPDFPKFPEIQLWENSILTNIPPRKQIRLLEHRAKCLFSLLFKILEVIKFTVYTLCVWKLWVLHWLWDPACGPWSRFLSYFSSGWMRGVFSHTQDLCPRFLDSKCFICLLQLFKFFRLFFILA